MGGLDGSVRTVIYEPGPGMETGAFKFLKDHHFESCPEVKNCFKLKDFKIKGYAYVMFNKKASPYKVNRMHVGGAIEILKDHEMLHVKYFDDYLVNLNFFRDTYNDMYGCVQDKCIIKYIELLNTASAMLYRINDLFDQNLDYNSYGKYGRQRVAETAIEIGDQAILNHFNVNEAERKKFIDNRKAMGSEVQPSYRLRLDKLKEELKNCIQ